MKKKFSKLLGVGLTLVLLASLMAFAIPVSAGTLSWSTETIPSTTGKVILDGSNVADLAVAYDGETIYAVTGTDNFTYKSTDAGESWSKLSKDFEMMPDLVAVAPDDADLLAVAGGNNKVFISTSGGTSFSELTGASTYFTYIYALDISPEKGGKHYITAGGALSTASAVAYFDLGATIPGWTDVSAWAGMADGKAVKALKFSPAFASDTVMLAVSENGTDTVLFEIAKFASDEWNTDAGFAEYDGIDNVIASDTAIAPLDSASIALPSTYYGGDESERIAFVGLAADSGYTGEKAGIYRMTDESAKELKGDVNIHSVAYTEGDKLVAGRYDGYTTVYRSADPLASSPDVDSSRNLQSPSGTGQVVVAWAGDNVVAGTSGTNSAFAVSKDDGATFNDISLIDTALTNLEDVALSADGAKVYLLTDDASYLSVWRLASSWERVLSVDNYGYIVRLAPEDADVVYLANIGGTTVYYSTDGGETRWYLRSCGVTIKDMAVESAEVVYALDGNGDVSKTENAGFIWGDAESTGLGDGATIVSLSQDNLIVGGASGGVAYSTDGNDDWTEVDETITSGNVQVTADGLADGNYIYAATSTTGDHIYIWEIGDSDDWDEITDDGDIPSGYAAYGIGLQDGVLYAVSANSSDTTALRTLDPTASSVSWSTMTSTAVFNRTPQALRISSGSTKLWAIDTEADKLYSYTDDMIDITPTLTKPTDGFSLPTNPITGTAYEMTFSWDRPSKATDYNLYIAYDSAFDESVTTVPVDDSSSTVFQIVGPYQSGDAAVSFTPGVTYYWKVKVTGPVFSISSETRSFTIEAAEVTPPVEVVIPPAPDITVEVPDVVVNIPPTPEPPAPAPPVPSWALIAIIAIGAVLLISVIALIVRTRRVV